MMAYLRLVEEEGRDQRRCAVVHDEILDETDVLALCEMDVRRVGEAV